jgi:transposase-like protein
MEQLCGREVTSMQVSRAVEALDDELSKWRERPLGEIPYLLLDARYEKVRVGGAVVSCSLLIALGVTPDGHRTILGASVSLSEAEVHWREFLARLQARGLHGVQLVISDDHAGLRAALQARLPGVKWQRCQFHLAQNLFDHLPPNVSQPEASADLRAVFNAPNRAEADRLLGLMVSKYEPVAKKLAAWFEANVPEGLTPPSIGDDCGRITAWSGSTARSNAEPAWRVSFRTKPPCSAWPRRCSWRSTTSGKPKNVTSPKHPVTRPKTKIGFTERRLHYRVDRNERHADA